MFKYAFSATFIASLTTLISIFVFKSFSAQSSIVCAIITALIISFFWGRSKKRLPTSNEKTTFIFTYGVLILILFMTPPLVIASYTSAGIATIFVMALTYPIFMLLFFREKFLIKYVEN